MNYIKVWCEYDIGGEFGGNNDQDVFLVPEGANVDQLLADKFQHIWDDIKEEDDEDENLIDAGLMGWEYISIWELK